MNSAELRLIISALDKGTTTTVNGVTKSLTGMNQAAKSGKDFLAGMGISIDALSNPALAAGQAVKFLAEQTWAMGKRGGVVTQTTNSFDGLLDVIGASPDLLERLRSAALGTVDDMTLMSSTATLLAGTSGDLATSLANATPELLEIAKAAQKLNPTLGDTTFLYQSIATGVKRASPLILDNLGLTIRLGEANEAYAKELGKTVEQLTADEQKQALLNETLRAGRVLIEQAGGSAESATDSFAALDTAVTNYYDVVSKKATPATKQLADGITEVIDKEILLIRAEEMGLLTKGELNSMYGTTRITVEELTRRINELENATRQEESSLMGMSNTLEGEVKPSLVKSYEATRNMDQAMQNMATTADTSSDEVSTAFEDMAGEVNRSLDSVIENMMADMQWIAQGGMELQAEYGRIIQELNDKTLAGAQYAAAGAYDAMEAVQVKTIILKDEIAGVDATASAKNISDTLGISLQAALDLVNKIRANAQFDVTSYVRVVYSEEHGSERTGGSRVGGEVYDDGGARGLSGMVPPGYPGDSYAIGATSGENVTITPAGNASTTVNNNFHMTVVTNATTASVRDDFDVMRSFVP